MNCPWKEKVVLIDRRYSSMSTCPSGGGEHGVARDPIAVGRDQCPSSGGMIVIFLAFLAASLAAGVGRGGGGDVSRRSAAWRSSGRWTATCSRLTAGFGFVFVCGICASCRRSIVALVTEALTSTRMFLFYALGGALFGLGVYLAFTPFDPSAMNFVGVDRRELEVMTGAGIVAGLVYWAIAGRRAGAWRS